MCILRRKKSLINRQSGNVEKIRVIRHISDSLDLCEIQIGFDELKIFYDANQLLEFLHKDVEYTVRQDVVDGQICLVICELAMLSNIQTVKSIDNIKLLPESNKRVVCNVDSKALRFGEFYACRIALLAKVQLGSSAKAKWFDCTMIDQCSREFSLRLFSTNTDIEKMEAILNACIGSYVTFDMKYTRYGLQTEEIVQLATPVEKSPEVVVAEAIVREHINKDPALVAYNNRYGFIDHLSNLIDGEIGYYLVRIASEIYMINAIDSITSDINIETMKRACICSYGYLLPKKGDWSRTTLNYNKAASIPELKEDKQLLYILDVLSEPMDDTKRTYIKIKGLVNDIIKIRRGIKDEESDLSGTNLSAMFNGLL